MNRAFVIGLLAFSFFFLAACEPAEQRSAYDYVSIDTTVAFLSARLQSSSREL